ncbi:MAG TPA: transcriptional repressor [Parachlamydiaceae bacterium]|nr:transcriptional repressor [Parachlamydiaceae bacterium]
MQRTTKQRQAILNCLTEIKRPLSIEEILSYTAKEIPHINLSTIYRTIKILITDGTIDTIQLPGDKSFYEMRKNMHHHHFFCTNCSKTYCINSCPKGLSEMIPEGFKLLDHSIMLNGLCKECFS